MSTLFLALVITASQVLLGLSMACAAFRAAPLHWRLVLVKG